MGRLDRFRELPTRDATLGWSSPANIAFVKYWGKKGHQLPANPSLSMTLKACVSRTQLTVKRSDTFSVRVLLGGVPSEGFAAKIEKFLTGLSADLPWVKQLAFTVETENTFPHGAGIASSASGLSAFCLCLTQYMHEALGITEDFFRDASYLSRLASGSACRSVYGGFTTWGEESDEFASPIEVHPSLAHLYDTVVVVSRKEKAVSSTAGHGQMGKHPFAEARFAQARANFELCRRALAGGDFEAVGQVLEAEALSLHAMMLTSAESFVLLKPQSLTAMELVREFRRETQLPLYFTLDAGPNLHLIYPERGADKIRTFIQRELTPLAQEIIFDECGEGPAPW
jgi:diphosphomevalonate decarboxylase